MTTYRKGAIVEGQVTGIENYGIFLHIDSNFSGLIHISEISDGFVKDVNDYVKVGETIYAKVIEVDKQNAQLKLTIKGLNYKNKNGSGQVEESVDGFNPLKEHLETWVRDKLKELEEKESE